MGTKSGEGAGPVLILAVSFIAATIIVVGFLLVSGLLLQLTPATPLSPTPLSPTPLSPTPLSTATPVSKELVVEDYQVHETGITSQMCAYGKRQSIVRDEKSYLHLFYQSEESEGLLVEATSQDDGKTWHSGGSFSVENKNALSSMFCSAALGFDHQIHTVFGLIASNTLYMREFAGRGWIEPLVLNQNEQNIEIFSSDIATGPGPKVHVVGDGQQLWYSFYDGEAWAPEIKISTEGWQPDIAVDQFEVRHIVFDNMGPAHAEGFKSDSTTQVKVSYISSLDGKQWSNPQIVSASIDPWTGNSAIAVDSRQRRHVTFIRDTDRDLNGDLFYTFSDDGITWSQPKKLNEASSVPTGVTGNESAAMALDTHNNLYVAWYGTDVNGKGHIYLRWLAGSGEAWNYLMEVASVEDAGLGATPSIPYRVLIQPNGKVVLDIVWGNQGSIQHAFVHFTEKQISP